VLIHHKHWVRDSVGYNIIRNDIVNISEGFKQEFETKSYKKREDMSGSWWEWKVTIFMIISTRVLITIGRFGGYSEKIIF